MKYGISWSLTRLLALSLYFSFGDARAQVVDPSLPPELQKYFFEADVPKFSILIYENNYDDTDLQGDSIRNSENDAEHLSKIFSSLDLNPFVLRNPKKGDIISAIDALLGREVRFEQDQGRRPLLFIFYAGHGFSAGGDDYITGRDFRKDDNINSSIPIGSLKEKIAGSADLILFSDACRTPIDPSPQAVGQSLDAASDPEPQAVVDQSGSGSSDEDARWLVSFAASSGRIAEGFVKAGDADSPYSAALIGDLDQQDVPFHSILSQVRIEVKNATWRHQYPQSVDAGAGDGDFYFRSSAATAEKIRSEWLNALRTGDRSKIEIFLTENASSRYAVAAKLWMEDHNDEIVRPQ